MQRPCRLLVAFRFNVFQHVHEMDHIQGVRLPVEKGNRVAPPREFEPRTQGPPYRIEQLLGAIHRPHVSISLFAQKPNEVAVTAANVDHRRIAGFRQKGLQLDPIVFTRRAIGGFGRFTALHLAQMFDVVDLFTG